LLSFFRSPIFSYNTNVTMDVIIYAAIAQTTYKVTRSLLEIYKVQFKMRVDFSGFYEFLQ